MVYDDADLSIEARVALYTEFGSRYPIAAENMEFTPPGDGSMWLKYDYMPAGRIVHSLDRKCASVLGLVQVSVVVSPGAGVDDARRLAKEIANFFEDGKILGVGYVYEAGEQHNVQKSERGWLFPVRFTVRYDGK